MKNPSLFSDHNFFKQLFIIAIPITLQNLFNAFVNMVDTVMIGRLGTVEVAAVGLGNQVFFLYMLILFGISSGGAVFTTQYWGKRDLARIKRTTGLCLSFALAASAIFTALSALVPGRIISLYSTDPAVIAAGAAYLRALAPAFIPFAISFVFTLMMRSVEKVRLPMITTIISLSINVGLNYLLIFGIGPFPRLGVVGAAVATSIARIIEMGILVAVSYRRSYVFAGTVRELFGFDAGFVRRFIRITAPVVLNEFLWSFGITMQNVIMARTGTAAIAAFNITNTVSMLTWVLFIGLSNGAGVLIGKKIGEGAESDARNYARKITVFAPMVAIIIALFLIPLSWMLPLLFKADQLVFRIITGMFIILAISYPFKAFNMAMIIGVSRAGGDTIFGMVFDVLFMWTIAIPTAALASFVFGAPVWTIYLCLTVEEPLKMFLGLYRLRSGKWLRNVTAA